MSFNFDESIERNHTDSEKWSKYRDRDIIPLWIADTDYRTAPQIIEGLQQRVAHGIFGYGDDKGALAQTTVDWVSMQYGWQIKPEWVVYLSGIKPVFALVQECLLESDQRSICHSPIYPPFTQRAEQCNRTQRRLPYPIFDNTSPLSLPLPKLSAQDKLYLLCNPHNPGGYVYRRAELEQIARYAQDNDLWVCSDEIHADLILEDRLQHIPFASLSSDSEQRSITLLSAAKSFNLAGLGCAVAIIPNDRLRAKFSAAVTRRLAEPSILSLQAMNVAWRSAQPWLKAQCAYLRQNRDHLVAALDEIPGLTMVSPEAGFLAWLDASALGLESPARWFETQGLGFTDGAPFGDPQAVRINFGCTRARLEQAIQRLIIATQNAR